MATLNRVHRVYAFADCRLDVSRGTLTRAERDRKLRPKSHAVLRYLVEHAGCLVSKTELLDAVWGDAIVSDDSITQCLIEIRRALSDRQMQIVRTIPRRGYVLDVAVEIFDLPIAVAVDNLVPTTATYARLRRHADDRAMPHRTLRWGTVLCALVALVSLLQWQIWAPQPPPAPLAGYPTMPRSIAVLPFIDLSPNGNQAYLADGLANEIIGLLAAMPGIEVIARTSSFSFRGKQADIATVAAKLRVSHVLEGSVSRVDDRIRISAQLIETGTSTRVWSQAYERAFDDAFVLHDEIAAAVAAALHLHIAQRDGSGPTLSTKAHEHYLQGRYLYDRRGRGDLERAHENFQAALDEDPTYAQAWAALSATYGALISIGAVAPEQAQPLRVHAVRRALALDPDLVEAHVYACAAMVAQGDWEAADEHRRRALAAGPDHPLVLASSAGRAAWGGDYERAISLSRRALSVDPLVASTRSNLGHYLIAAGRYQEARQELAKVIELQSEPDSDPRRDLVTMMLLEGRSHEAVGLLQKLPASPFRDRGLALAGPELGQQSKAQSALLQLIAADTLESHIRLAEIYAFRGDYDRAFTYIASAHARLATDEEFSREQNLRWELRSSPFFIPLRTDPRWNQVMAVSGEETPSIADDRQQS